MSKNYEIPFDIRTSEKYSIDRVMTKHVRLSEIQVRFSYADNTSLMEMSALFKKLSESYPDFTLTLFTKEDFGDEDFVCYLEKKDEVDMSPDEITEYDRQREHVKMQRRKNDAALARVRIQSYEALLEKE
jgi:hypothetical protein